MRREQSLVIENAGTNSKTHDKPKLLRCSHRTLLDALNFPDVSRVYRYLIHATAVLYSAQSCLLEFANLFFTPFIKSPFLDSFSADKTSPEQDP
jgi:hypothetical protein